jgi:nucleoside-diphosphate-sugar epimerase
MSSTLVNCCVVFGGTGFIGLQFAKHLLDVNFVSRVYLVDIESIKVKKSNFRKRIFESETRFTFIEGDVRLPLDWLVIPERVILIANFAAIHREPGHNDEEYFETNINGAENVCTWAELIGCNHILFTSSISPYGSADNIRTEFSLTMPSTPYGISKLISEYIHKKWQSREKENRRLIIVRPGVVFGPGEGGNVTRLIKAVKYRYFFYTGNKNTRKAGIYVFELCEALYWSILKQNDSSENVILFNATMDPAPSVSDYVCSALKVLNKKSLVFSVPYVILRIAVFLISFVGGIFKIHHPFSPVRLRKMISSNHISPMYLKENGYIFKYDLEASFFDWRNRDSEDW